MSRGQYGLALLGLLVVAALSLAVLHTGCAGGTGDPGDPGDPGGGGDVTGGSSITGAVVDATDTSVPVAGAQVSVADRADASGRQQSAGESTVTGNDGRYRLDRIRPGWKSIVVEPPAGSGYVSIQVDVDVPEDVEVQLNITLLPSAIDGEQISLTVTPATAELGVGETRRFTAAAVSDDGTALELTPTWSVAGGIGTIDSTGLFTAGNASEEGLVLAKVGRSSAYARVKVTGLSVTPTNLSFVSGETSKTLSIANVGMGEWTWSAKADAPWLSVSPTTVNNAGNITVRVDRTGLQEGHYTASITVSSVIAGHGSVWVPVDLTVSPGDVNVIVN